MTLFSLYDLSQLTISTDPVARADESLAAIAQQLEDEGVQAFAASFDKLMASIKERAETIRASRGGQLAGARGRRGGSS